MYLDGYDLEVIKEKLDKAQKGARVRIYTIEEVDKLIKQIEDITVKLKLQYPKGIFKFILTTNKNGDISTNIKGEINNKGFINLDNLDIGRERNSNINKISFINIRDIMDGKREEELLFAKQYNCTFSGDIYL